MPEREPAHVERVLAVGVLVRVELGERRLVVDVRRRGVLDQHGVDLGGVVHLPHGRHDVGLGGVVRKVHVGAAESELGRRAPA